MARKSHTVSGGIEVGYHIHIKDGWYGKNYFYYLKTQSKNKTEGKMQYSSMLKRFLLQKFSKEELGALKVMKEGEEQTTYIHATGPCYWLERREVDFAEFDNFKVKELVRLEEGRKERQYYKNMRNIGRRR